MKKSLFTFLFFSSIFIQAQQTQPIVILPNHTNDVNSLSISYQTGKLASAGNDKTINIYNIDSPFKLVRTLNGMLSPVNTVEYSKDGKLLAAGSSDNAIRLWDSTYKLMRLFEGHTGKINALLFDRLRKYIFSGGDDRKIIVWEIATGKVVKTIEFGQAVNALAQSNYPQYLFAAGYDTKIRMYNMLDNKVAKTFDGHTDIINSISIHPNGNLMVSGSNDKTARIWDTKTGKEVRKLGVGCWKVTTVAFSPEGDYIITGCNDGSIKVWETATGKLVTAMTADGENIRAVECSANWKYVFAASMLRGKNDFGVRVWNATLDKNAKPIEPIKSDSLEQKMEGDSLKNKAPVMHNKNLPNKK